jgi:hypothetical protein
MLVSSRFFVRNVFLSTALWNSRRLVVVVNAMSTHTTTRNDGTVTIAPRNEASQSALMVICHGLGDSAEGFADVAEVRPSTTRSDLLEEMSCMVSLGSSYVMFVYVLFF